MVGMKDEQMVLNMFKHSGDHALGTRGERLSTNVRPCQLSCQRLNVRSLSLKSNMTPPDTSFSVKSMVFFSAIPQSL